MNIVVTGGSRGIGAEIVRLAAEQGHSVAFTFNSDEVAAEELVHSLSRTDLGSLIKAYKLDVRSSEAVDVFRKAVENDFGNVDAVIPNAGINRNAALIGMTDDQWRDVLETNLSGAFFVSRAFLPLMLPARFGRFVFLSSVSRYGMSGQANYAATKAGLLGLSNTIAKEYGSRGITSNVVAPGVIDTDLTKQNASGRFQRFWQENNPLKRNGTVTEVANAVLFLAGQDASYINGACLSVSAGLEWVP